MKKRRKQMEYSIILLAGNSSRTKSKNLKQYLVLNGQDLFLYSLNTFYQNTKINKILLVCDKKHLSYVKSKISNYNDKEINVIEGGKSRKESVFNALNYIKENEKSIDSINVLIHDAARPFINNEIINNCIKELKKHDAITVAIKANDTIIENKNSSKFNYLNRDEMLLIQTPQCFKFNLIYKAHLKNKEKDFNDDTQLVQLLGKKVFVVEGSVLNVKITTKNDIEMLSNLGGKHCGI